ncbi:MAG: 3-hydroxyacyl-CoA dehydrogenase family protein [Solirubrobacteraceae bacterium]
MKLGVAGAGTMGAGIAEAARAAGLDVLVHDPHVAGTAALEELADRDVVIEAAPEDLELKRGLFRALAEVVAADAVLATNTSSLTVGAVAAAVPGPERVVGLHFFNPVPRMRLVELVAGPPSSEAALARAGAAAEAMGKQVVRVHDGPGFLVNRCNRPFGLEAMRIVQERLATPEQVDRICRLALGFRMGPFELMDLVGIDVGVAIAASFHAQTLEPRWRPSPLAARLAESGRLGRQTGQGWYAYPPGRPGDPPAPEAGGGEGRLVVVAGETEAAAWLLGAAEASGWDARTPWEADDEVPSLILDCGPGEDDPPLQGGPQALLCDAAPLSAQDPGGSAAGFALPLPVAAGGLVELTRTATTAAAAAAALEAFFATLGRRAEWVGDGPGLVGGRIVAQLVTAACFALGEGVADAAAIDLGMVLGLNHPRGPLAWGDAIGPGAVLDTLLALWEEYREERYRPSPVLVRAVRAEADLAAGD